jgi:hypothetical protein
MAHGTSGVSADGVIEDLRRLLVLERVYQRDAAFKE